MLNLNIPVTPILMKDGKDQEDIACDTKQEVINMDVDVDVDVTEEEDDGDFDVESNYDGRSLVGIKSTLR